MSVEQALENIHEFGNGWYLCKASASACWASMVFAMQTVCLIFQLTCVEDEWGLSTEWGTVITIFRVAGVLSSEILLGPATDIYGRWVVLWCVPGSRFCFVLCAELTNRSSCFLGRGGALEVAWFLF